MTTSRSRQALANCAQIFGVVVAGARPVRSKKSTSNGSVRRRGVHVPVVQVQAASETQHDIADLLPVPQLAHHLFGAWIFC